jgi:hypothetical protein
MAIELKQQTMFLFSSVVGETTYNFQIPASNQAEAVTKLLTALGKISEDLKAMSTKPMAS